MADDNDNNGDEKSKIIKSLEDINTLPSRVVKSVYDIHEHLSTPTKHQSSLQARLKATKLALKEVNGLAEFTRDPAALDVYRKRQATLKARIVRREEQIKFEQSSREEIVRRDAYSRASSMLSEERLEINTRKIAKTPGARFLAEDIAGLSSQAELERVSQINTAKQSEIAQEMIGLSRNVGDVGSKNRMSELARELSQLQIKGGRIGAAISLQREMGLDDVSLKRQASTLSEKISKEQMREGVAADIQSGKVGSYQEELDIYKKLRDAVKQTAEEMSELSEISVDLRKKQEDQIDAYEKQKEKIRQIGTQGGDGGGGLSGSAKLRLFGEATQAGIAAASYIGIGSEIEQTRVRAGLGAIMNQRFFEQKSALSGDMNALLRAGGGLTDAIIARSELLGQRATNLGYVDLGAKGAEAAGSIAELILPAGKGAKAARAMSKGDQTESIVRTIGKAGTEVAYGATSLLKDIQQGNIRIDAYSALSGYTDEIIKIRSQSMQEFYNDRMKAYRSSIGAGSLSPTLMSEMTNARLQSDIGFIDLDRQKNLFSMGVSQVGVSFTHNAQERQAIIRSAARAERTGMMSAEQYMGNLGQIAAGGGTRKDFEELMANAVARGVGDAENINKMVEYSANLAESIDQGRGVGGIATAFQSLAFGQETYAGTGMDQRQIARGAAFAIQNLQNMTSQTGMNLETMSQMAYLSKAMPDLKGSTLFNALNLGTQGAADVLRMIREDPNSQRTLRSIEDRGLKSAFYTRGQDGKPVLKADAESIAIRLFESERTSVNSTVGLFDQDGDYGKYIGQGSAGDYESMGYATQDALSSLRIGRAAQESAKRTLGGERPLSADIKEPSGDFKLAQDALAISTQAAVKNMNSFGNNLKEIVDLMRDVSKNFSPEVSAGRTQEATEKMNLDIPKFSNAVGTFASAVKRFEAAQAVRVVPGGTPQALDIVDKIGKLFQ